MGFPWFGFSTMKFDFTEQPLMNTDTGWVPSPTIERVHPLGSVADDIQLLARGSDERSWEAYFGPDRYEELALLVATTGTLVDNERPVPGSRLAFLAKIQIIERSGRTNLRLQNTGPVSTREARRVRLSFVSQS